MERAAPRGFGIVSVLWALPKAAGLGFDGENATGGAGGRRLIKHFEFHGDAGEQASVFPRYEIRG